MVTLWILQCCVMYSFSNISRRYYYPHFVENETKLQCPIYHHMPSKQQRRDSNASFPLELLVTLSSVPELPPLEWHPTREHYVYNLWPRNCVGFFFFSFTDSQNVIKFNSSHSNLTLCIPPHGICSQKQKVIVDSGFPLSGKKSCALLNQK